MGLKWKEKVLEKRVPKIRVVKVLISLVALILVIIHMWFPNLKVDSITLGFFIAGVLPWIAPMFKSLELPGGMKFELQDYKEIEEKANSAGLIPEDDEGERKEDYSFLSVAKEDPKLALAGLRIELEDSLRKLAESNDLTMKVIGIRRTMELLSKEKIITREEYAVLADITGILNAAVHSQLDDYNYQDFNGVLDLGVSVLNSLNQKIPQSDKGENF